MAGKFVLTKSKNGQFHFVLKAGNGETIAQSEMYKSKAAALAGIESVRKNAGDAKVDDQSEA
jgi:uncharacterized protein YegP (UPF0339 family)